MGGFRALTRVKSTSSKPRPNHSFERNPEQKKQTGPNYLQFVKLNEEQDQRKMSNVDYKELPTTVKMIEKVIQTQNESEDHILITLQRYRDFFNPILNENQKYEEDFKKFTLAMLLTWHSYFKSSKSDVHKKHKQILRHLKEMASMERHAPLFVNYLRNRMQNLAQVLVKLESAGEILPAQAISLLNELESIQSIFIRVMECPAGKLIDCLIQLGGQIYSRCNKTLLENEVIKAFENTVSNDIKMMQKQQSKAVFNPVLSQACQRLPQNHPLRQTLLTFLSEKVIHPQLTTQCLVEGKVPGPRLEYLQLGKQKPKPIACLKPLLDDEFMLIERKWKPALDEKTLKRKIKAEEKMTVRELKKDTFILQQEKQRIKTLKVQKNRKAVFRGGNAPKDEV